MAGIKTTAQAFGGWEPLDSELRGHSLGHFLSALALMYASTGDEQYRVKGVELVEGLAECQQVLGTSGYLSAFPEHFIDRAIQGGDVVWAPWYTLHKMYAGLLDQYTLCRNQQAYKVLMKMCDWAYNKLRPLAEEDLQRMLLAEFGGMPEVFYNIYAVSGDIRHKELAEMLYHYRILDTLAAKRIVWPDFMPIPRFRKLSVRHVAMNWPGIENRRILPCSFGIRLSITIRM